MKKRAVASLMAVVMTVVLIIGILSGCGNTGDKNTTASNAELQNKTENSDTQSGDATADSNVDAEPNAEKSEETLTIVLPEEPASLLVESTAGSSSTVIRMLIGDRLLDYDDKTGEFKGAILESWEIVDENHLRGFVRKGMKAYDGSEYTAQDIIYSLQKAAELSPIFLVSGLVVENCVAEDDFTVLFETNTSVTSVMGLMATGINSMLDESSVEASGGIESARTNPCWGVGKYKFVEWVAGQYVMLERNEDYWDDSYVGYYKNIKFTFVSDAATRVMSIMSGTADVAPDIALGSVLEYMDSGDCSVLLLENGNANGLQLNCSNGGPLSDVKVREAIRYAIDGEALNMIETGGYAKQENFYILSSSKYYYDPTNGAGVEYNPEKAKELLTEAGYPNGFELDLLGGAADEEILTAVQSMLAAVGITANLDMPDRSVLVPMSEAGEYDIYYGGHSAALKYMTLDVFKQVEPNSAGAGLYMGGPKITDPDLQRLIDTAVGSEDETKSIEAVADIVQYLYDNVAYIGVNGAVKTVVVKSGLTGARVDAGACFDLSGFYPAQ